MTTLSAAKAAAWRKTLIRITLLVAEDGLPAPTRISFAPVSYKGDTDTIHLKVQTLAERAAWEAKLGEGAVHHVGARGDDFMIGTLFGVEVFLRSEETPPPPAVRTPLEDKARTALAAALLQPDAEPDANDPPQKTIAPDDTCKLPNLWVDDRAAGDAPSIDQVERSLPRDERLLLAAIGRGLVVRQHGCDWRLAQPGSVGAAKVRVVRRDLEVLMRLGLVELVEDIWRRTAQGSLWQRELLAGAAS